MSPAPAPPSADEVVIRMYNVGFGDCFRLSFPAADRRRTVLIDCGVHQAGLPPEPFTFRRVVEQLLDDLVKEDGGRVDVVIGTHRHRDHVLGFENTRWEEIEVGEVWLPWTEDESDPEARRIVEVQATKAKKLTLALAEMRRLGRIDADAHDRSLAVVQNSDLTNFTAMETLLRGFKGRPRRRYLPEKLRRRRIAEPQNAGSRREVDCALLPGVRIHVLGPSRAEAVIREMDPPGDESFLHLAAAAGGDPASAPPFALAQWALSPAGGGLQDWLKKAHRRAKDLDADESPAWTLLAPDDFVIHWLKKARLKWPDIEAIDSAVTDDAFAAAVALDQAVNGTSLMLVFEIGNTCLLFPGDAQWGTWQQALADPGWSRLLARTRFLKVGHHGSHNATPRSFVKLLSSPGLVAMCSTRASKKFKEIPREPLLEGLRRTPASSVIRSDIGPVATPFVKVSDVAIEARVSIS